VFLIVVNHENQKKPEEKRSSGILEKSYHPIAYCNFGPTTCTYIVCTRYNKKSLFLRHCIYKVHCTYNVHTMYIHCNRYFYGPGSLHLLVSIYTYTVYILHWISLILYGCGYTFSLKRHVSYENFARKFRANVAILPKSKNYVFARNFRVMVDGGYTPNPNRQSSFNLACDRSLKRN